jgi:hypothetical protein
MWLFSANISLVVPIVAEYQAVLDRATTEGFALPSDEEQIKGNQLMIDLINSGAFANMTTLQVYAGSNSDFSRIDWVDPTNIYQAVNSPTYNTVTGFKFDGATNYLSSNNFEMTQDKTTLDNYGGGFNAADFAYDGNFRALMGIQESAAQTYTQFIREEGSTATSTSIGGNLTIPDLVYLQDNVNYIVDSDDVAPSNHLYDEGVLDKSNALQFPAVLINSRKWTVGALLLNGNPNFYSHCSIKYMFLGVNLRGMETDINNAFTNYLS